MATPYLGEIKMMSFIFPPKGWALCNGQLLPINQNQALFALLGTTYGGDGRVNFALPNLQGRAPLHVGGGFTLGEQGGEENHTLSISELPTHFHAWEGSENAASKNTPLGNWLATSPGDVYTTSQSLVPLTATTVPAAGGSQPHLNQQPYLTLSFCIALQGIFPTQN